MMPSVIKGRIRYLLSYSIPSVVFDTDNLFYSSYIYTSGRVVSRVDQSCETRVLFGEGIFPAH